MNTPETPSNAVDPEEERTALFEKAIALQRDFDALANTHDRVTRQQLARRERMVGTLRTQAEAMDQLATNGSIMPDGPRKELREEAMNLVEDFDKDAVAYVAALHRQRDDWRELRDILAAFIKTRSRLRELGTSAPEFIEREDYARQLEPHAFTAAHEPTNPAQN